MQSYKPQSGITRNNEIILPDEQYTWEEVTANRITMVKEDRVYVSYQLAKNSKSNTQSSLLSITFTEKILNHVGCAIGDKVILLAAKENIYNYCVVKAEDGYKIAKAGAHFMFSFRCNREGLRYFRRTSCKFILNNNETVRVIFPS